MATKNLKSKIIAWAAALAVMLAFIPPIPAGAAGSDEFDIAWLLSAGHTSGTGWTYDDATNELTVNGNITITGKNTNYTGIGLVLDIAAGCTVTWDTEAVLESRNDFVGFTLIDLKGGGTFEVQGTIKAHATYGSVRAINSMTVKEIIINGGEVSAETTDSYGGCEAIYTAYAHTDITVKNGSTITAYGVYQNKAIYPGQCTVDVQDSTICAYNGSTDNAAIYIEYPTIVNIDKSIIQTHGNGAAIYSYTSSLSYGSDITVKNSAILVDGTGKLYKSTSASGGTPHDDFINFEDGVVLGSMMNMPLQDIVTNYTDGVNFSGYGGKITINSQCILIFWESNSATYTANTQTDISYTYTDSNGDPVNPTDVYWGNDSNGKHGIYYRTLNNSNALFSGLVPLPVYVAGNSHAAYTITFDATGGTVSPATAATGADGRLASLPVPSRSGYTFDGWFTAGGTQVTTSTVFAANTTVYAEWTAVTPGRPDPDQPYNPDGGTSGYGTVDGQNIKIFILNENEFSTRKGLLKVKLPRSRLAIASNADGMLGRTVPFKISAERLKTAGLDAKNLKLSFVDKTGKVTDESKIIVKNSDGSVTLNFTHFSVYVLAEDVPVQCSCAYALEALKASLKEAGADEIGKYDCNYDGKVTAKDALFILKAAAA